MVSFLPKQLTLITHDFLVHEQYQYVIKIKQCYHPIYFQKHWAQV